MMSVQTATDPTASSAPMETDEATKNGPEIVSEFPSPPAFFVLYRDGENDGPPPPKPLAPKYHMFGTPYSTQDEVPDLLPQEGSKLYLPKESTSTSDAASSSSSATAAASVAAGGGTTSTSSATSSESGATPSINYKQQMKKLNHSLLMNFIELVDVLIKKPSMFNDKLNDMEQLFLNMHNLINTFRPHQARETIIQMLKNQIEERREAAHEIRRTIDEARKQVEATYSELHDASDQTRPKNAADVVMADASPAEQDASDNHDGPTEENEADLRAAEERARRAATQDQFFGSLEAFQM